MKTKFLFAIIGILFLTEAAYSSPQAGVYLSLQDYKNDKLTEESDCSNGAKIYLHNIPWPMPYLTIVDDKGKHRYEKSSLYGYRDCDNNVYRLYRNEAYKIQEVGDIYIYTQPENITQTKGFVVVNAYYFSKGPDGDIVRLSYTNLKRTFEGNSPFLGLLDESFTTGSIAAYDEVHGMYKVNYLYSKTIK